ncbi:MAG: hypothetical protein C7B46_00390 [Sulfobacillus benefaciens]|uniref:Uncharacterized protein n=1 Tax=Sulfobacillus benefaciens TaxID=453960 RepID=A0A2T2XLV3_9FIRM|nr:MAG: hypothetical protein C7B46_00390 [Sulfobacillus benefaciens]
MYRHPTTVENGNHPLLDLWHQDTTKPTSLTIRTHKEKDLLDSLEGGILLPRLIMMAQHAKLVAETSRKHQQDAEPRQVVLKCLALGIDEACCHWYRHSI